MRYKLLFHCLLGLSPVILNLLGPQFAQDVRAKKPAAAIYRVPIHLAVPILFKPDIIGIYSISIAGVTFSLGEKRLRLT